jgi:DNA mismatch endonuclease (patch repair protein)
MVDVFSQEKRSAVMASIRSKDTKPELRLRAALHREGLRYRLHVRALPGAPDIVLPKHKSAIQVRGCFWHHHTCKDGRLPGTRQEYWRDKLLANAARDEANDLKLCQLGWKLFVIWECEIASGQSLRLMVERIVTSLRTSP